MAEDKRFLQFNDEYLKRDTKFLQHKEIIHSISVSPSTQVSGKPITATITITNGVKNGTYNVVNGTEIVVIRTDANGNFTGSVNLTARNGNSTWPVDLTRNSVIYDTASYETIANHGLPIEYRFLDSVYVEPYDKEHWRGTGYGFGMNQRIDDINNGNIGILILKSPNIDFDTDKWCIPSTFNVIDCVYDKNDSYDAPGKYVQMNLVGAYEGGAIDSKLAGFTFGLYDCKVPSWPYGVFKFCGVQYTYNTMKKAPILCNADGTIYNFRAHR